MYFCKNKSQLKFSTLVLIASLFLSLTAFAQKEARQLKAFNELKVYGRFDVILVKGDAESVTIESTETEVGNVLTEVEDGKLRIRMKTNYFKDTQVKVVITFKQQLREIIASAGAVVDAGTLESKKFKIETNSGAELKGEVITDSLTTITTQGSLLTLSGKANYYDVQVSTGGQLTAYLLNAQEARARVNAGGYAKITVKEKLDAAVNMGGNISYKGEPKEVKQGTTMGGSITQIRE